jgi:quinoprotein dehydrogenase-associated probable ABC transporter substrate-binding protein
VCADPNNLPFSNQRLEGFENRLAELVADELETSVEYVWWAQRRGFLRHTLNAQVCDLVVGLPTHFDQTLTTRPYYTSSYVLVTRRDDRLNLRSLDDERLKTLRIGVTLVGDDGANTPPAHALSRRGLIRNVVGFSVFGDYTTESPPARIVEAVAQGDIDVALAWGPMAGYFARRSRTPLDVTVLARRDEESNLPFAFDISMAVRRDDVPLRDRLNALIERRLPDIDRILAGYGVPLTGLDVSP